MISRVCSTARRALSRVLANCQAKTAMLAVSRTRASPISQPACLVDQLRIQSISRDDGRRAPASAESRDRGERLTAIAPRTPASWLGAGARRRAAHGALDRVLR